MADGGVQSYCYLDNAKM